MVQRLCLAASLVGDPRLVILDEPTSNLDPLGRMKVIELIKMLEKEKDINFLISTHVLSDLEVICDYLVMLNRGKVVWEGSLVNLLDNYGSWKLSFECDLDDPLKEFRGLTVNRHDGRVEITCKDQRRLIDGLCSTYRRISISSVQLMHSNLYELFALIISEGKKDGE